MGELSKVGNAFIPGRDSRGTSAAESIIKATEPARRASAAIEKLLGQTEQVRRASERTAVRASAYSHASEALERVAEARQQAESERIDREKRALELSENLLEAHAALARSQADLIRLQEMQAQDAKHDRKIQYAVLILTALGLVIGVVALFT